MESNSRYDKYKKSRDAAWNALIVSGINELPVNLKKVAEAYKISVYSYKTAVKNGLITTKEAFGDSFSKVINGGKYIFISNLKNSGEVRFDIACEIGHFALGHKIFGKPLTGKKFGRNEYEAYIFARDLLMPATVLNSMGINSPEKIEKLCGVTHELAVKRAERLNELYIRKKFNTHPTERKVFEQFENYINIQTKMRQN